MTSVLPRNPTLRTAETSNFEGLWGSSTQWKSSVPRSQRLNVYHPSSKTLVTSAQTAVPLHGPNGTEADPLLARPRPPPDLNKPLPPLPAEARDQEEEKSLAHLTLRRKSTVSRSLKSYTSMGNIYHDAKRMATLALTSKKRKAGMVQGQNTSSSAQKKVSESASPPPVVAERAQSSSGSNDAASQTTIVPVSAVTASSRPSYVDQGTQLEVSTRSYAVDTANTFRNFAIRPALQPSGSSASSHRSPKQISGGKVAPDYFHFQPEDINGQMAAFAKRRPKTRSSGSQELDNKSFSSGTRSTGEFSTNSVGTYESKYSAAGLEAASTVHYNRPCHRRSVSDSTLTIKQHSTLEPQVNNTISPSQLTGITHRTSEDEAGRRKPPIPKYSSSRALRQYSRSAHRSENSSPLRQEITPRRDEMKTFSESPDRSIMFRVPVSYINPAEESMYTIADVPEHLTGSPLCPLHPKHKTYGVGICPFHGRLLLRDSGEPKELPPKGSTPPVRKSITINDEAFKLIMPKHDIDSAECPANPKNASGGKGVCVYHGRRRSVEDEKPQTSQRVLRGYIWT